MSNKIYFTPGPSQLYAGVDLFIKEALEKDYCSISHRSGVFKDIFKNTSEGLKKLLNIPANYTIVFTGSATEIWERVIGNCVSNTSFHFVNGSFSKKFYQYAAGCGVNALKAEAPFGSGFNINDISIPSDTELICFTHNETSSGVSMPLEDMYAIRKSHPNSLIVVDGVSSIPHPNFDWSKIDSAFFSVQKCFGLPAGLGVWIVNDKCINKATALKAAGKNIGPHHELPELAKQAEGFQTPATPNVLGIFLLGKVVENMLEKGIDQIRKETSEKAALLYAFLEESQSFSPAVKNTSHRSETVIVANSPKTAGEINTILKDLDFVIGSGYGNFKDSQVRIANFPSISIDNVKKLIERLKTI